jgi:hypothetical protein
MLEKGYLCAKVVWARLSNTTKKAVLVAKEKILPHPLTTNWKPLNKVSF